MFENLKTRFLIIFVTLTLAVIWLVPNFISVKKIWWPSKSRIIYGLDIQGGLHLVLEADVEEVVRERLERFSSSFKDRAKKENINIESLTIRDQKPYYLDVQFKTAEDLTKGQAILDSTDFKTYLQILKTTGNEIRLAYYETRINSLKKQLIEQSIEVIRNRIDEFGVSEPLISAQGDQRILVQLPGIEDSAKAKDLIQKAAQLEFAVVSEAFSTEKIAAMIEKVEKKNKYSLGENNLTYRDYVKRINRDLRSQLPDNHKIVFEKAANVTTLQAGRVPYVIDNSDDLKGSLLEDAFVSFDQEFNRPQVSFQFQPEGRRVFADLTGRMIGKRLAIVLDDVLKSAPTVEGKIYSNPRISLGSGDYDTMLEEANMISTTLRAGSLPVQLRQLEEKTVGPTLGRDSVNKGKTAGLVSLVLVMFFMLVYYKFFGVIANICLGANMFFLLSLLSSLEATLTLPGVAGIILTIGMAVDANVIIFERIKEEFKKGASLKLAVKEGFEQAFSAILDANITTAIVCSVLVYFGTGPIRGFAITLFCGILTSLFTAIFLSKTLLNFCILKYGLKKI